jgi:hypothetical protein
MYLIVESLLRQLLANVPDFGAAERRPVVELALEDARLAAQQLQQLAHRHAGGEPVRVHDHVRADALHTGHRLHMQYSTYRVKPCLSCKSFCRIRPFYWFHDFHCWISITFNHKILTFYNCINLLGSKFFM